MKKYHKAQKLNKTIHVLVNTVQNKCIGTRNCHVRKKERKDFICHKSLLLAGSELSGSAEMKNKLVSGAPAG